MKERPILFSGAMVRALLAGTKTQTRRIVKPQPEAVNGAEWRFVDGKHYPLRDELARGVLDQVGPPIACPYGAAGDRLWVRETVRGGTDSFVRYDADDAIVAASPEGEGYVFNWRRTCDQRWPAIHMPRWASRVTLEVLDVRVERLQDISEADASAEGVRSTDAPIVGVVTGSRARVDADLSSSCRGAFACLWDGMNGKRAPWESNPWVFAVSFKVVPKEVHDGLR